MQDPVFVRLEIHGTELAELTVENNGTVTLRRSDKYRDTQNVSQIQVDEGKIRALKQTVLDQHYFSLGHEYRQRTRTDSPGYKLLVYWGTATHALYCIDLGACPREAHAVITEVRALWPEEIRVGRFA